MVVKRTAFSISNATRMTDRNSYMRLTSTKDVSMQTSRRVVLATSAALALLSFAGSAGAQSAKGSKGANGQLNSSVHYNFPVRFSLIDDVEYPRMGAKVSRGTGPSPHYLVQIRRDALSTQLVATAFALIDRAESHHAKHASDNLALFIPDAGLPLPQRSEDVERFERIVAKLKAASKGQFVEVSSGG